MAIQNVVKLMEAAQENPELASKLETVTSAEQIVEIGAGEGLEFTTEEAEAFRQKLMEMAQKAEDGELKEDELEAVAGGNGTFFGIQKGAPKNSVGGGAGGGGGSFWDKVLKEAPKNSAGGVNVKPPSQPNQALQDLFNKAKNF